MFPVPAPRSVVNDDHELFTRGELSKVDLIAGRYALVFPVLVIDLFFDDRRLLVLCESEREGERDNYCRKKGFHKICTKRLTFRMLNINTKVGVHPGAARLQYGNLSFRTEH